MSSYRPAAAAPDRYFRLSSGQALKTTPVFDMYWHYAAERQDVFHRRIRGEPPPWTEDPIIQDYRFTNAYRASDRVSQFLIRDVIYQGDTSAEEVFFRTLLFKLFNRIETWQLLREHLGDLSWKTFRADQYEEVLGAAVDQKEKIYSGAYIMPCPPFGGRKKFSNHLSLLSHMMKSRIPLKVESAHSLQEVYIVLRSAPSVGPFLAFQFSIDLNYSEIINFSEMDFVVAGPGARSGIRKSFESTGRMSPEEVIGEVAAAAEFEFRQRGLPFQSLWGRPLQLIDCQNLFCEIDKYTRVALPEASGNGRTRMKRRFASNSPSKGPLHQWYPPKWGIDAPRDLVVDNGNGLPKSPP